MLSISRSATVWTRSRVVCGAFLARRFERPSHPTRGNHFEPNTIGSSQIRGMARYEGPMPKLNDKEFVILTPEVSGPGGMSVPAELGEVCELAVKVGDYVKEDAVVAIIDTCKASIEARCRASGVVTHVLTSVGETVFELQPLYVVEQR
uniref:Lipoyl-binding domain-containing protein n=1 Tax=Cryptomonas curvata TaxID=233186 RepID=A0A7S0MA35_9CRYP|mmetsp:Transcript_28257/g.59002  ORF Transcript_28257/g.59002 Transcript_28257/m.59002 type:complete len:149 (+) Transcript_28257:151-597(+)